MFTLHKPFPQSNQRNTFHQTQFTKRTFTRHQQQLSDDQHLEAKNFTFFV